MVKASGPADDVAEAVATPVPAAGYRLSQSSSRPQPTAERPRRVRREREELSGDQLEALLSESAQGLSAVAIARQLSVSPKRVVSVLRESAAAGRVRREGSRRTSRWRVVTDEERIAERAAQLAAQGRSAQTQP